MSSRSRLIGPATFETIPEEDESALEDSLVARANVEEDSSEKRKGETDGNGDESALDVAKRNIEEDCSERREGEDDGNGDKPALVVRTNIEKDTSERKEGENDGNDDKGTAVAEFEEETRLVERREDHSTAITEASMEMTDVVDITS